MNPTLLKRILDVLPALIQSVEDLMIEPGSGRDKLQAVLKAILALVPADKLGDFMQKDWPKLEAYVSVLVAFYHSVGFFKAKGKSA